MVHRRTQWFAILDLFFFLSPISNFFLRVFFHFFYFPARNGNFFCSFFTRYIRLKRLQTRGKNERGKERDEWRWEMALEFNFFFAVKQTSTPFAFNSCWRNQGKHGDRWCGGYIFSVLRSPLGFRSVRAFVDLSVCAFVNRQKSETPPHIWLDFTEIKSIPYRTSAAELSCTERRVLIVNNRLLTKKKEWAMMAKRAGKVVMKTDGKVGNVT